jgi:MFS family permease
MRWKLLITTSVVAAFVGFGLWCAITIGIFGSARSLARNDGILPASILIPFVSALIAGYFAYRHTARRRKMQALITTLLAIFLTVVAYFVASVFAHNRFYIPRTYELRHRP